MSTHFNVTSGRASSSSSVRGRRGRGVVERPRRGIVVVVRTGRERLTSSAVVVLSDGVVGGVVGVCGVVGVVDGCGVSWDECLNIVSQECCRSRANHDERANATL